MSKNLTKNLSICYISQISKVTTIGIIKISAFEKKTTE